MNPVAAQSMSLSYASRHTRRVPGLTSCVRRCVGVARAAREGLPPVGDGLRTPWRASTRASSATKAPQRSPRGTRPSSPPPRPGGTRTERRLTRPRPLSSRRRPVSFCPANGKPAFAHIDASQARPNAVPAPDFNTGSPSVTTSE